MEGPTVLWAGDVACALNGIMSVADLGLAMQSLKTKFNAQTVALQGSGWGWLGYDKDSDTVKIHATPNQDPLFLTGMVPLLGIDVWE